MEYLSALFDDLMVWLNANEGVVEGIAVLIAVVTLAFPQLRAAIFGGVVPDNSNGNGNADVSALDPALIDSMLMGAAQSRESTGSGSVGGSFFSPRLPAFGRFDQTLKSGPVKAAEGESFQGSPLIVVFPFDALDEEEGRAGICRALADEIATGFAGMAGYEVLAGRAVANLAPGAAALAHLGARYVVEGSIRNVGSKTRIIVRITDAASGRHLWAERFDCLSEKFCDEEEALFQRITWQVIDHVQAAEVARAAKSDPHDLDSWSLTVLAFSGVGASQQKEGALEAERLARKAVKEAPGSGMAQAVLAATLMQKRGFNLKAKDQVSEDEIRAKVDEALTLAPDDAMVNVIAGFVMTSLGDVDIAIPHLRRGVELLPVNARAHAHLGRALRNAGNFEEAAQHIERALAIAPRDPMAFIWWGWIAVAQFLSGDAAEAIASEKRAISLSRRYYWNWLVLAAAYGSEGRVEEAKSAFAEAKALNPDLEITSNLKAIVADSLGADLDISPLLKGLEVALP